jgi:hypothetical protein
MGLDRLADQKVNSRLMQSFRVRREPKLGVRVLQTSSANRRSFPHPRGGDAHRSAGALDLRTFRDREKADVERDLIRTRTGEGRERASHVASIWGAPEDDAFTEAGSTAQKERLESVADLVRCYGVSPAAINRTMAKA